MRRQDWVSRLWREVNTCAFAPFAYGQVDCCTFVARCVDAMTGGDLAAKLAQCYHDRRSARQFIRAEGGIELAIAGFLGDSIPGANASPGDVCLIETEDGLGAGIYLGSVIAVKADCAPSFYPLSCALAHWRV
jgi:hypothetical protein